MNEFTGAVRTLVSRGLVRLKGARARSFGGGI